MRSSSVPRRVTFGYALDVPDRGVLVATADTALMVLGAELQWSRLPPDVRELLPVSPDPVRLF